MHWHLYQHSVLAVGWSEYMNGPDYCDVDVMDAVPNLLLGYGDVAVYCAVLVQRTSRWTLSLNNGMCILFVFPIRYSQTLKFQ